jgi:hypothetical protein
MVLLRATEIDSEIEVEHSLIVIIVAMKWTKKRANSFLSA